MKAINWTNRFKHDHKRETKSLGEQTLNTLLTDVLLPLISGEPLPYKYKDHALTGDWLGCRDCHLRPDLLMIYEIADEVVTLHRLGSHSELFG